jgi:ketosteroid isomerase-like protein
MKHVVLISLAALLAPALLHAQQSDEVKSVFEAERQLALVYQKGDVEGIARGVMEDYTLINSRGKMSTRADDIAEATKKDPAYEIFENSEMKARVHGTTAIVTGITHAKGMSGGKPFDARFLFTDTFVKDNGQWRLAAGHVSRLDAGKIEAHTD